MDKASLSRFRSKSLGGTVRKWTGATLLLASLTMIGVIGASAVGQRHYTCYRAAGPIIVDGKLDEPSWESTPDVGPFVDTRGETYPAPYLETRVLMLWDDSYFYVGADMEEPDVWGTLTEWDAVIFHDNDFEVFIDPNGDELEYYEFEMNALNTGWDLFLDKPYDDGGQADHSWDIEGLKTAVHVNGTLNHPGDIDESWSVEIAFPWEVLAQCAHKATPPESGDEWRVQFCRVEYRVDVVDGRYQIRPGTRRDWLWAPQRTWVHDPEDWGYVYFSTDEVDIMPVVVSATTTLAATVGQPTPLEFTVVLAGSLEVFPQMRVDLSPIGLSSTFPLQHQGAGQYTASTIITLLQTGRYYLPVMVETAEGGDWYRIFTMTLDVYPQGDMIIYEEGPGDGWTVEAYKAVFDLQATDCVHSGSTSHAITPQQWGNVKYLFEDPGGFSPSGYTHLEFYIHPGVARIPEIMVLVRPGLTGVRLTNLGIDFERREWQQVQIPLGEISGDVISSINLFLPTEVEGTLYIDDMRLVAEKVDIPTAVEEIAGATTVPLGYALAQNYPNPFNSRTMIRYDLLEAGEVRLSLYNLCGQLIRTLVDGHRPAGSYSVVWDGRDGTGRDVASGVYLYRIKTDAGTITRKMLVLR